MKLTIIRGQGRNQEFLPGGPDNCAKNTQIIVLKIILVQNLQEHFLPGEQPPPRTHAGYGPVRGSQFLIHEIDEYC